jgi:4-hydroxybenzoate polyprenyltransferase
VTAGVAAAAALGQPVLVAAVAVLAYVAGLTYAAHLEACNRIGSLWPLALLAAPLVLAGIQFQPTPAMLAGLATILVCTFWFTRLLRRRLPGDVAHAVALLIAGISVNDALLAATTGVEYAPFACLACFGLTLLLQRHVPAT